MAESSVMNRDNNTSSKKITEQNRTLDWDGIDSERLRMLRQSGSATKGLVTKALNDLRNLMHDCTNVTLVKIKLEDLKLVVDDHQNLTDKHSISESNEYSEAVNHPISDSSQNAITWNSKSYGA